MDFEKLVAVYNRLQDDESKKIFSLMLKKTMSNSQMDYIPELSVYCHNPRIDEVFINKLVKCDGIVIYGCGGMAGFLKIHLNVVVIKLIVFVILIRKGLL